MNFSGAKGGAPPFGNPPPPPPAHCVCAINCFAINNPFIVVLNFTYQSWQVCPTDVIYMGQHVYNYTEN